MGRQKQNPRYEVISLRVSDEEKEAIAELAEQRSVSISDLLRDAIERAGLFKKGGTHGVGS